MVTCDPSIQLLTPLPPLTTGIAQYSRDLLNAVDGHWSVRVLAEQGSSPASGKTITAQDRFDPTMPTLFQLGNSEYHRRAFHHARDVSGLVTLHDVVLHHARLAAAVRDGRGKQYVNDMKRLYGYAGERVARDILRGSMPPDLLEYPLSEDYAGRASVTAVHNEFARTQVLRRNPDARVVRVPMGVPLPALVDQQDARRALGLPSTAFVLASITHVNPMKRLPVVLRSLRRAVQRVPETIFIIAGSEAPGVNLDRQIELLGLTGHVRRMGYVTDDTARLLARAADACVNLRYPATGETSASLLRLLGAERPVLVTDGIASSELPSEVGIRIPVDRFEEEFITELLVELASDATFRSNAGRSARHFVETEHSMQAMADGYREAIRLAFGLELPPIGDGRIQEEPPELPRRAARGPRPFKLSPVDRTIGEAIDELQLGDHGGTIQTVAERSIDLGLDTMSRRTHDQSEPRDEGPIRKELLDILACPFCKEPVRLEDDELVCASCSRRFRIEDGVPIMLVDEQA